MAYAQTPIGDPEDPDWDDDMEDDDEDDEGDDEEESLTIVTPYLSIESLNVGYGGTRVLNNVSLDVARGELVALLGSSGCGKTTLLRSIAGFVTPESGAIKVDGRDIARHPPIDRWRPESDR